MVAVGYRQCMLRFRDEAQRVRACQALMAMIGRKELWSDDGPSDEAVALLEQDGGALSAGERAILLLTFSVWCGDERAKVVDLDALDSRRKAAVAGLIQASALASTGTHPSETPPFSGVDQWCEDAERELGE